MFYSHLTVLEEIPQPGINFTTQDFWFLVLEMGPLRISNEYIMLPLIKHDSEFYLRGDEMNVIVITRGCDLWYIIVWKHTSNDKCVSGSVTVLLNNNTFIHHFLLMINPSVYSC